MKHLDSYRSCVDLVLNDPSQFLQCFAVTLSIHRLTPDQELGEQNAASVPEHRAHYFSHRQSFLEFRFAGRSTVSPIHWLLLVFWGNVCNLRFITLMIRSRNSSPSSRYRCRNVNADSMHFPCCSGVSWHGIHLAHNFLIRCSVTILCNKEREIYGKWLLSSVIVKRLFSIMRSRISSTRSSVMMDGLPLQCSSSCTCCRPVANCQH